MEIIKVEVLSLVVRALVHFWDLDYRCFSFRSIDLCHTMEEYGMLTEFPSDLYIIDFPLRSSKIIPDVEATQNPQLGKIFREECCWSEMEDVRI